MRKADKRMCEKCVYRSRTQCSSGGAKWWASGMVADVCSHEDLKEDTIIVLLDKCPADRSDEV
jgi:hypothetical protein